MCACAASAMGLGDRNQEDPQDLRYHGPQAGQRDAPAAREGQAVRGSLSGRPAKRDLGHGRRPRPAGHGPKDRDPDRRGHLQPLVSRHRSMVHIPVGERSRRLEPGLRSLGNSRAIRHHRALGNKPPIALMKEPTYPTDTGRETSTPGAPRDGRASGRIKLPKVSHYGWMRHDAPVTHRIGLLVASKAPKNKPLLPN